MASDLMHYQTSYRFEPHPDWPAQRTLDRYEHLVGFSIRQQLESGGTYIDIGPGTHAVALRELDERGGVGLVALTPDQVDISGTNILVEYGRIPDAVEVLQRYSKKCRVVTDVFSATTYVQDPAYALLALSCLPDDTGKVGVFTELDKFGASQTWAGLEAFFAEETGQSVRLEPFNIKGDAEPIWVDCLRITIEGCSRRTVAELPELRKVLHYRLGAPKVGREIWRTKDGKAVISEINYGNFPAPSQLMRMSTIRPA
jgi:hypothetical protein